MDSYTIPHHQPIKISPSGSYLLGTYTDTRLNLAKEGHRKIGEGMKHIANTHDLNIYPSQSQKHLIIQTKSQKQTEAFLKAKTFSGHDAKFELHRQLSTTQTSIIGHLFLQTPLAELGEELAPQGVISIRRAKVNTTPILILTTNSTNIPDNFKIGHIRHPARLYYPLPLRCRRCQRYGHGDSACTAKAQRCARCAEEHPTEGCSRPPHCAACDEPHQVTDSNCLDWKMEKEVCRWAALHHQPVLLARAHLKSSPSIHMTRILKSIDMATRDNPTGANPPPPTPNPVPTRPFPALPNPALHPTPPPPLQPRAEA